VKLQVETAGGGDKAELVLPAISKTRAEELRYILESKRPIPAQKCQETEDQHTGEIFRLSTRDLFILSSTSNSIGVVLVGLLVIFSQLEDVFPDLNIWNIIGDYVNEIAGKTITTIILVVLVIFLLAWILSLLGNFIKFGGFELIRMDNNIKINRGLMEKKQLTIPINQSCAGAPRCKQRGMFAPPLWL
jgi:putative membrane protein